MRGVMTKRYLPVCGAEGHRDVVMQGEPEGHVEGQPGTNVN
jgi:hypothetical protein